MVHHHHLKDYTFSIRTFEDDSKVVAAFDKQHNLLDTFRVSKDLDLTTYLIEWSFGHALYFGTDKEHLHA